MQEHVAIDVSPGPIQTIHLFSDYFPHFYLFAQPALCSPDPRPVVMPTIHSAPQLHPDSEPEGDSDDSTALGILEFTLLSDKDNSTLHCMVHRAKASQLRTRTVRGTGGPVWEDTLTYHSLTRQDAGSKTLRSFDLCLEKRRLTKRRKSLGTARGMSLYEEVQRGTSQAVAGLAQAPLTLKGRSHKLLQLLTDPGPASPTRRRRQRWLGRNVGASCCHCATALSGVACCFLRPNVGKKSKYKTSIRKKTLNPEFSEEFFYASPREELAQKTLLVSVWDYDLGTADDFFGGVQLSGWWRAPAALVQVPGPQ